MRPDLAILRGQYQRAGSRELGQYVARLPSAPNPTRRAALRVLTRGLKLARIWGRLDVLRIYAAPDTSTMILNIARGAYAATNNGGALTPDAGVWGNGSTAYIDEGFDPTASADRKIGQNDETVFLWSLTAAQDAGGIFGPASGSPKNSVYPRFTDDLTYYRANVATSSTVASTDGSGLFAITCSASTVRVLHKNGVNQGAGTTNASSAADAANFNSLRDRTNYHSGGLAVIGWGRALNDAQHAILYTLLNDFLHAIGAILSITGSVVSSTNINGPEDVLTIGNYAYVPCRDGASLTVIDISNPASPSVVQVFTDTDIAQGMGIAASADNSVLFMTSWNNRKFLALDRSNPASVSKISSISVGTIDPGGDPDSLRKVVVRGSYAYLTHNYEGKLYIVNVSNPASMSIVGSVATGAKVFAVDVDAAGDYAYLVDFYGTSVYAVDVRTKASPSIIKTLTNAAYTGASCVHVVGTKLLVTFFTANTFVVFDITTPASMAQYSSVSVSRFTHPNRFYYNGDLTYVAAAAVDGVGILNTSDLSAVTVGSLVTSSIIDNCYGVTLSASGYVCACGRDGDSLALLH